MANLDLTLTDNSPSVVTGSTGDDVLDITLAGVFTNADANTFDGNGGTDTATIDQTLELAAGALTNGDIALAVSGDDLVVTQTGTANDTLTFTDFTSLTFDNGTLTAAAATTEYLQADDITETYSAAMTIGDSSTVLGWDGAAVSDATGGGWSVTAVNGTAATTGGTVTIDGVGVVTVTATGSTFTADASYLAGLGLTTASQEIALTYSDGTNSFTETFTVNFTGSDNSGNDTINADPTDTVDGGAGDDYIVGASGAEELFGSDGDDTVYAGSDDNDADTVAGGDGDDILAGGADADLIVGDALLETSIATLGADDDAGSDTIYGGAGNDTIVGSTWDEDGNTATDDGAVEVGEVIEGTSADEIWAGAGNDSVVGGGGADTIGGGDGDDTIFSLGGADVVYTGASSVGDTVDGGDGNDTIYGGSSGDVDSLTGGAGDDELYGGSGNDVLSGGTGSDTLYGGAGDDNLTGGTSSADVFYFGTGSGADTVVDFEQGVDDIDLSAYSLGAFSDVLALAYEIGGDTVIELTSDDSVTLTGESLSGLTASDFIL